LAGDGRITAGTIDFNEARPVTLITSLWQSWDTDLVVDANASGTAGKTLVVQNTAASSNLLTLRGPASMTGAHTLGTGKSSTGANREQFTDRGEWVDSTDATRKGRRRFTVYDTAEREAARGWADGSAGRWASAAPASAPTDAHLAASQISFYLDESGNNLKVRVKYADGTTLKTGTVALV
jgi:hypothetical protein